jgi:hypothetical protein
MKTNAVYHNKTKPFIRALHSMYCYNKPIDDEVYLTFKPIPISEYKKTCFGVYRKAIGAFSLSNEKYDYYPDIYYNGFILEYNDLIEEFMPDMFDAHIEGAYFLNQKDTDIVNLIINVERVNYEISTKIIASNKGKTANLTQTYLMVDSLGFIKIGSSFDPGKRETTLRSTMPDVKIFATSKVNVESILHNEYGNFRIRGEWFKLDEKQISDIIKNYVFTRLLNFERAGSTRTDY